MDRKAAEDLVTHYVLEKHREEAREAKLKADYAQAMLDAYHEGVEKARTEWAKSNKCLAS